MPFLEPWPSPLVLWGPSACHRPQAGACVPIMQKRCANWGQNWDQKQGCHLQAPGTYLRAEKGASGQPQWLRWWWRTWECYLEPSSFDAPVELIVLTAPAPEAVGHPVALTQRQAASLAPSSQCTLWPLTIQEYPASYSPPLAAWNRYPDAYSSHNLCDIVGTVSISQSLCPL